MGSIHVGTGYTKDHPMHCTIDVPTRSTLGTCIIYRVQYKCLLSDCFMIAKTYMDMYFTYNSTRGLQQTS